LVVRRLTGVIAGVNWSEASRRLVGWLDPVAASPASPSETVAAHAPVHRQLAARALAGDQAVFAGVPLCARRAGGARWSRQRRTPPAAGR
jgi:hypothetical protein